MERLTMLVNSHLLDNGKLDKEYDLNNKIQLNEYSCMDVPNAVYNKLGELEDVLEEFELTSAEDLRNYLNFKTNMAIWEGKFELKNKIADLEAKLAESEKKYAELFCRNIELETLYSQKTALLNFYKDTDLVKENQQLKQQLAEKDKEIVRLNKFLQAMKIREHNQDEISFAIEQLELARRRIDRLGYNENKCLNKKDCIEDCLEEIDNQINGLKEMK